MSEFTAIVLAAGAGSRFGGAKLLAPLDGRPVLQHVLDTLAMAGVGDVVVVLGQDSAAIESAMDWRSERRVVNEAPERGLSSSVQVGVHSLDETTSMALIVLGDQPRLSHRTIRALMDASRDPDRPIVVPRYPTEAGRNPVLLRRSAFEMVDDAQGDRGLGPLLAAHPDLVLEVAVSGANPDVDTREDLARLAEGARQAETAWADRVRANRDQVERIREVPDGQDFYAPVSSLFRADPDRSDDPVLDALRSLTHPGDTWLDVGAGAGRFALPLARTLGIEGGSVVALDASASMLGALREIAEAHGIENVQLIEARWPPADPELAEAVRADTVLIAHVGYDVELIGPFVDALEAASRRDLVAVMMDQVPASAADGFWPLVHDERRVPLPALGEFVDLLRARGSAPFVERITTEPRRFESREALGGFVRRQLWIDPAGPKEQRFQAALEELDRPGRGRVDHPRTAPSGHRRRDLARSDPTRIADARSAIVTAEEVAPDGRPMIEPADRAAWRAWLAENHTRPTGVWVVMDRRGANPDVLDYVSSVEEALCFGWIDSKVVKLDAGRTLQWYSPRRPRGTWARTNKERVERLTAAGLMTPAGLAVIEVAKRDGTWTLLDDVEDLIVPDDLAAAFERLPPARSNWDAFSRSSRRAILVWIVQAQRPETRAARVAETARRAAVNEKANEPRPKA